MIDLCNKIDRELIEKMAECRPIINNIMKEYVCSERGIVFNEIKPVYNHLKKYETRYTNNKAAAKIMNNYSYYEYVESGEANLVGTEFKEEVCNCIVGAMDGIEELLSKFLPPLENKVKPGC